MVERSQRRRTVACFALDNGLVGRVIMSSLQLVECIPRTFIHPSNFFRSIRFFFFVNNFCTAMVTFSEACYTSFSLASFIFRWMARTWFVEGDDVVAVF